MNVCMYVCMYVVCMYVRIASKAYGAADWRRKAVSIEHIAHLP